MTKERKENISKGRKKWSELHARGYRLTPTGYYEYTKGEYKGRLVHVIVMEQHICRKINKNEIVHHINGIKTDNQIKNLQIMTRSEHSSLHAVENMSHRQKNKEGRFICH